MVKKILGKKLNKIADKHILKNGYVKTKENEFGVSYEKYNDLFNYIEQLEICKKRTGKHLIFNTEKADYSKYKVYQYNKDEWVESYFSIAMGIEYNVVFWVWLKTIGLKWEYNWG